MEYGRREIRVQEAGDSDPPVHSHYLGLKKF